MIALSSKTYLLQQVDEFKISRKGINKRAVTDPATQQALFDGIRHESGIPCQKQHRLQLPTGGRIRLLLL